MPAPLKVNRESVKTLAIAVGVREAARQLGIAESTVQAWSKREHWFAKALQPPTPPTMNGATVATKPSDALARTLSDRKDKSALHLSRYVVKASEQAARLKGIHTLTSAQDVRHVAGVRSHLWPEDRQGDTIDLRILSIGGNVNLSAKA
jgi:hypothetical protein